MSGPRETIVNAVKGVAQRVGDAVGRQSSGTQQTLTVGRPVEDVAALWHDPAAVRQVLGEVGTVEVVDDVWTWRLSRPGADEPVEWRTALTDSGSPRTLRWSGIGGSSSEEGPPSDDALRASPSDDALRASELVVVLREAPQDLGTEQVVRLDLPVPGLAAGAMALGLCYRARALVMTGEVPTITPQPAGRSAER